MLQTLKSYSPEEAAVILAGLTRHLLPEELTEPARETSSLDAEMRQRILGEVYKKLRVNAEDESEESQAQVINYIGREMSRVALAQSDLEEIAGRVGQQGNLRPDAYKVILTSEREKESRVYGILRGQIKDAASHPSDFQHLLPGIFGPTHNAISLFIKEHHEGCDPFTILVQAKRTGSTLSVTKAFKIYHSDVELDSAKTPLDVLLAFLNVYGVDITVGDETSKFVLYKSVPRPSGDVNIFSYQTNRLARGTRVSSGFHFKATDRTIEVAVGYMIDETKYLADLKKHKYK